MRVAVIGSRGIDNFDIGIHIPYGVSSIVSGGAKGIDSLARAYAIRHKLPLVEYLPDYAKHGRGAPLRRNRQIIEYSDFVLAVWDGVSKGTLHSIRLAERLRKPLTVVNINDGNHCTLR